MSALKARAKSAPPQAAKKKSAVVAAKAAPARAAVKPAAIPPPAPSTRVLTGRRLDPAAVRAAFAAQSTGNKLPYMKLTSGRNQIRLLGPKDPAVNPSPTLHIRFNKWDAGKYTAEAIDLDWLFSDADRTAKAIASGRVTQEDFKLWQKYGRDPWTIAGDAVRDVNIDKKRKPYLFPNNRFLFNAINRADGQVYLYGVGKQTYDAFLSIIDDYDILDEENGYDLLVKGNGQDNLQRRYTITPVPQPSPAGLEDSSQMVDLEAAALRNVVSWETKVRALFKEHGDFLAKYTDLTPESFGVSADNVPAGEDDASDE